MRFVAGQGAGAQSHREDVTGRGTDAEVFLAGALQRRAIGKMLLAEGAAVAEILLAWGAAKCGKEGGALRWGPCAWGTLRGNPCWVTSVGDPALGNKGVLGAGGLYLNQLRGFCFVVPCQSSK